MAGLSSGARQLPLRHISIRVPWNDTGWGGNVCQFPSDNMACLCLPRIRETRDDGKEEDLAGQSWEGLDEKQLPPCMSERGSFMAPFDIVRHIEHPYVKNSEAHSHMLSTSYRYPQYSAACIPFNWMLKDRAAEKAEWLELNFRQELEDKAHEKMKFDSAWIQTKHNQLAMLDTFFSAIQPEKSLCFFYAKQIPLIEDNRRVLIGVGWVSHVGDFVEYKYSQPGPVDSVIWERPIQHSIRDGFEDGFLLPYHEVIQYLENHPEEDPTKYIAFAPEEHFEAFSYTSEHVTSDGAVASLLACLKALENIEDIVEGPWSRVRQWVDTRLNEIWRMRGPYPGLGAALTAFGISSGTLLAYELELALAESDDQDPWPLVDDMIRNPERHDVALTSRFSATKQREWIGLPEERRNLLKLLSRFELSPEQATRYYVQEDSQRDHLKIYISDQAVLQNPYLLYECDRVASDAINLAIIDRGLFPDAAIREKYPLSEPSNVDDPTDPRRVRAFVVRELEKAAADGHTVQTRRQVIQNIRDLEVQPPCPVTGDLMGVLEGDFEDVIRFVELADGERGYQLDRLEQVGKVIRSVVLRRTGGARHQKAIAWRERLDSLFVDDNAQVDALEDEARVEKTAALEELYASRFSVLIGPAGTGKTTLLRALCHEPEVEDGGVLLLAPTGKARARIEKLTDIQGAKTIAQFLLPLDRYDPDTGAYRLSTYEPYKGAATVIIDEASMLTEEQLAAVLNGLSGVQRLILVGDHRQLPPIGAGRPFLDIVRQLQPENIEALFPRVTMGYAELTVGRRQRTEEGTPREDLLLADWFSGRELDPGADAIWARINEDHLSDHLRFVRWDNAQELRDKLLSVLVEELGLSGLDDQAGFEQSLGGTEYNGSIYFHAGRDGEAGACAQIEDWQILSPVRNDPHGVALLNRLIQKQFRSGMKENALDRYRKTPKPMGPEEILYGDKVINIQNHRHNDVWPGDDALQYVANGEIGSVVGQFKGRSARYKGLPWKLEVEFSSQPSFKYGYSGGYFKDEGDPILELAYALTIHKVQGSEFGLTFLIVPDPCRLLSRELLYTGLTRQQNRVIIFHQGDRNDLKQYSVDRHSEAARRLTNLFKAPKPVLHQDRFMEEGLIHQTQRGESVRSKSEVIIAGLLYTKGIDYEYEAPLRGNDGQTRYPDFTFVDDDLGRTIYWEHLGLLHKADYKKRWDEKLNWYKSQGIYPYQEADDNASAVLVTSQDDANGGINVQEISQILDNLLT